MRKPQGAPTKIWEVAVCVPRPIFHYTKVRANSHIHQVSLYDKSKLFPEN
jgi:hypothetical protein